jgi:glyoxylase-like metal-dependent hydrolase (beta-lactamase superfamily II)
MKNIVFGLILIAIIAAGCAGKRDYMELRSESDGIFSYKVGNFMVYTLVDAQREGNTGILVDANEAVLERFIPETGFSHSTNAFLVRTPQNNILIDTGFGNTIIEKIEMLGLTAEQIDAVLITHLHGDHFAGIQREGTALFPNAKIYVSANDLEYFTQTQVNQGAVTALAPYTPDNVVTFDPAELGSTFSELLPGIKAIANYGHTPGHTVFLIENGKDKLIIAGDFLHVALVQFAIPDISATFDVDKEAAAASRKQILGYAAENNIPIGAMHIVFPGIGFVEVSEEDEGGFTFTPVR